MPFKSDKQRKWMHANEPEMAKKWEKEESINEANASVIRKKLLKQFGDDPLYKDFIIAKTPKDQKKALKTLKSIRGFNAVRLMQKYVKKLQGESIKGKLRNVIRQEIKSINEIKTKDSKGKPIKPGELYYFTFIGAGRHKKPKVVKVIRNDAKGIVYHDFGDNSKYTIPMSLIKRKKMGGYFTLHESINEGKKRFKVGFNIGKAKYVISHHDGRQKHKDGSDFFGISIYKNQKAFEKGQEDLKKKGYIEESVDESGILYRAGVKKYGKEGMRKIQQAAGKRKSHAEIGKIKDKYEKDKKGEGLDPYKDFNQQDNDKEYDLNLGSFIDKYQKMMKFMKKYKEVPDKNKRAWASAIRKKVGKSRFNGLIDDWGQVVQYLKSYEKFRNKKDAYAWDIKGESIDEGFGSAELMDAKDLAKFEKTRQKNAEVLGYKLTGKSDIKPIKEKSKVTK